jgi:hypothetical protein
MKLTWNEGQLEMACDHHGPKMKKAKKEIPSKIVSTKIHLNSFPQGKQLQQRRDHATDARIATPTIKIGYFTQSGTEECESADTT